MKAWIKSTLNSAVSPQVIMVLSTSPTLEHTVRKSKFLFKNSNSENYKIQNSEKKQHSEEKSKFWKIHNFEKFKGRQMFENFI